MGSVTYMPPPGKARTVDVTVGEVLYSFMPGVPKYVPAEHIARVRTFLSNMAGVLGASPTPTAVPQGTGGAATWTYKIVPVNAEGVDGAQSAAGSTGAAGNATLTAPNFNRIAWAAVPDAVTYKVIRFSSGGTPAGTGVIATTNLLTFDDNGSVAGVAYVAAVGDALGGSPTPAAAIIGTAGAVTWGYRVVPFNAQGVDGAQSATGSTAGTANATLTGVNLNRITWTAVTGAAGYKILRQTSGGTPASTGVIASVDKSVLTLDDVGQAAVAYVAVTTPIFGSGTGPAEL